MVADALSRDPFAKTVGQRLIIESYNSLLAESGGVGVSGVQDTFRLKVQCHRTKKTKRGAVSENSQSQSDNVVKAVLDSHDHWDEAAESRATELVQSVQRLVPPGQDLLPVFSLEELRQSQELDSGISRVMPFLSRKRRPSRREKDDLDRDALALINSGRDLKSLMGCFTELPRTR